MTPLEIVEAGTSTIRFCATAAGNCPPVTRAALTTGISLFGFPRNLISRRLQAWIKLYINKSQHHVQASIKLYTYKSQHHVVLDHKDIFRF